MEAENETDFLFKISTIKTFLNHERFKQIFIISWKKRYLFKTNVKLRKDKQWYLYLKKYFLYVEKFSFFLNKILPIFKNYFI